MIETKNGTRKLTKKKRYILCKRKNELNNDELYNLSVKFRFRVWRYNLRPLGFPVGVRYATAAYDINFHHLRMSVDTLYIIFCPQMENRWRIDVGMINDCSANAFRKKMEYYANSFGQDVIVGIGIRGVCVGGKGGRYEMGMEECVIRLKQERLNLQDSEIGYGEPGEIIDLGHEIIEGVLDYQIGNGGLFGDGFTPGALADEYAQYDFGKQSIEKMVFGGNSTQFLPPEYTLENTKPVADNIIVHCIRGRKSRRKEVRCSSTLSATLSLFDLFERTHFQGLDSANLVQPNERNAAYTAATRAYLEDRMKNGERFVPLSPVDQDQTTGAIIGEVDHNGNLLPWARSHGNQGEGSIDELPSSTEFNRHPGVKPELYDKYHGWTSFEKKLWGIFGLAVSVLFLMATYSIWVSMLDAHQLMQSRCAFSSYGQTSTALALSNSPKEVVNHVVCKLLAHTEL